MENFKVMQGFESASNLDQNTPDLLLSESFLTFLELRYPLVQISSVGELHDYAASRNGIPQVFIFQKGLFIRDHVGTVNGCENSNFVDSIFDLFFRQVSQFNLFESVLFAVGQSLHLVD